MPPNPPNKRMATQRVASPPPSHKKYLPTLGKSRIHPWTTTEIFIWGSTLADSWLCVVRYMSMHYKIFLGGKKWLKS